MVAVDVDFTINSINGIWLWLGAVFDIYRSEEYNDSSTRSSGFVWSMG